MPDLKPPAETVSGTGDERSVLAVVGRRATKENAELIARHKEWQRADRAFTEANARSGCLLPTDPDHAELDAISRGMLDAEEAAAGRLFAVPARTPLGAYLKMNVACDTQELEDSGLTYDRGLLAVLHDLERMAGGAA